MGYTQNSKVILIVKTRQCKRVVFCVVDTTMLFVLGADVFSITIAEYQIADEWEEPQQEKAPRCTFAVNVYPNPIATINCTTSILTSGMISRKKPQPLRPAIRNMTLGVIERN